MEIDFFKAIAGLASALGTVAVYRFNLAQAKRSRAELIEKLEKALENGSKHSVCELFHILHGLPMDYADVRAICDSDRASKIVLALQRTPGMVKHEGGSFQYTELYKKPWVRRSYRVILTIGAATFGLFTLALIAIMTTMQGISAVAMLVFVIPLFAFLTVQLKDLQHERMVNSLFLDREHNQGFNRTPVSSGPAKPGELGGGAG